MNSIYKNIMLLQLYLADKHNVVENIKYPYNLKCELCDKSLENSYVYEFKCNHVYHSMCIYEYIAEQLDLKCVLCNTHKNL
jgi:hypothetical protein